MTRFWLSASLTVVLVSCATFGATSWQPGAATDLRFETSEFLKKTAFRKIDKVATDLSATGAYGPVNRAWEENRAGKWFIEEQRVASEAIAAGIAYGNQDAVERGLKILEWGWSRQSKDGAFDCPDRFHSTSFFVEATAHSILLLEASTLQARVQVRLDAIKTKVLLSALWMIQPKTERDWKKKNEPYTHRSFLVAAALGQTGILMNNEDLARKSREYVHEGIARQDPSGFYPEKDGWDASYHAVGLRFALRYLVLVASSSERKSLETSIGKGIGWLKTRILADGSIEASGNTRTGNQQERGRDGASKGISYGSVYRVLKYWSLLYGDPSDEKLATKVFDADQRQKGRS